jgi:hypothetical protein
VRVAIGVHWWSRPSAPAGGTPALS